MVFSSVSAVTFEVDDDNSTLSADFLTIRDAVSNASNGDKILVNPGVYLDFVVDKKLNLTALSDPSGSSPVLVIPNNSSVSAIIEIISDDVVIDGFKVDGNSTVGTGIHFVGIRINTDASNSDLDNILIQNNLIEDIHRGSSGTTRTALGIQVYTDARTSGAYQISDVDILDNTIRNITSNLGGAYGIQTVDDMTDVILQENNISDISGAWSIGVAVDSHNGNTTITEVSILNNTIFDILLGTAVLIESSSTASDVLVNHNKFIDTAVGVYSVDFSEKLDATLNYWDSCDGPTQAPNVFPFNISPSYPYPSANGTGSIVFGNVTFNPWIGVCIGNENPICSFEGGNTSITFELNATTDLDSVYVSYLLNGTVYNKTSTNSMANVYTTIINSSELEGKGGQNVTWNIYAIDEFGNLFNTSLETFYINKKTILSVSPSLPDGISNTSWYMTEPTFTLSNVDAGEIFYQWDSDAIFNYLGSFQLEDIPNQPNVTAGILDLNYWSNYSCGNETKQKSWFYIDLTKPEIKDLIPSNGSIVYNNRRPNISAYLDEVYQSNSGIDVDTINFELDGFLETPNISIEGLDALVWFVPGSDLSLGNHTVKINLSDNVGHFSSKTWKFQIVETPALSLTINSPENETYGQKRVPINVSLNGTVKILEYIDYRDSNPKFKTLCKDCNESGFLGNKTRTFDEGQNIFGVRATDYFGQINEANITFFGDSIAPKISRIEPSKGKFTNGSDFFIRYTEENVAEVLLSFNPVIDITSECNDGGKNQECSFEVNLTGYDGQEIEYLVNITDISGKKASSKLTKVNVDTTKPVVNYFNYSIDKKNVNFIFNVTEVNFDEISYFDWDSNKPVEKKLCSNLKNQVCEKKVSFKEGNHNLSMVVKDKAGNLMNVESVIFTL